jgi:hypothetical protein
MHHRTAGRDGSEHHPDKNSSHARAVPHPLNDRFPRHDHLDEARDHKGRDHSGRDFNNQSHRHLHPLARGFRRLAINQGQENEGRP